MEKMLDLGNGLKVAKVNVNELKEQDVNAREMDQDMFNQLTANIKSDGRLESLPFVAETEKGLEIVSGHHRVRSARSAGIDDIYVLVDDTGLSRNKIRSKQLSHNSIQGVDNEQIVKQIYEMIDDANDRLAAFISKEMQEQMDKLPVNDVTFEMEIKSILVNFMACEEENFQKAADMINAKFDKVYAADIKVMQPFIDCMKRVGKDYDIRAMSTTLDKMAEIVRKEMGEELPESESAAVKDVLGSVWLDNEQGTTILKALEKGRKQKIIKGKNGWDLIVRLCADYLNE